MAGQYTMALAQYHRARGVWRKSAAAGLTPSGELSPGEALFFAVAVGSVLEMAGMQSDALLMYRRCEPTTSVCDAMLKISDLLAC